MTATWVAARRQIAADLRLVGWLNADVSINAPIVIKGQDALPVAEMYDTEHPVQYSQLNSARYQERTLTVHVYGKTDYGDDPRSIQSILDRWQSIYEGYSTTALARKAVMAATFGVGNIYIAPSSGGVVGVSDNTGLGPFMGEIIFKAVFRKELQ